MTEAGLVDFCLFLADSTQLIFFYCLLSGNPCSLLLVKKQALLICISHKMTFHSLINISIFHAPALLACNDNLKSSWANELLFRTQIIWELATVRKQLLHFLSFLASTACEYIVKYCLHPFFFFCTGKSRFQLLCFLTQYIFLLCLLVLASCIIW